MTASFPSGSLTTNRTNPSPKAKPYKRNRGTISAITSAAIGPSASTSQLNSAMGVSSSTTANIIDCCSSTTISTVAIISSFGAAVMVITRTPSTALDCAPSGSVARNKTSAVPAAIPRISSDPLTTSTATNESPETVISNSASVWSGSAIHAARSAMRRRSPIPTATEVSGTICGGSLTDSTRTRKIVLSHTLILSHKVNSISSLPCQLAAGTSAISSPTISAAIASVAASDQVQPSPANSWRKNTDRSTCRVPPSSTRAISAARSRSGAALIATAKAPSTVRPSGGIAR